jgi:hypothetical protein
MNLVANNAVMEDTEESVEWHTVPFPDLDPGLNYGHLMMRSIAADRNNPGALFHFKINGEIPTDDSGGFPIFATKDYTSPSEGEGIERIHIRKTVAGDIIKFLFQY